jgi:citrate lyase subunit beta/citryl-CoA lyase
MNARPQRLYRSLLFSPGIRPELMNKADRSGADALIFDLEDSVPPAAKAEARAHVAAALQRDAGLPVYVRVNHPTAGDTAADIASVEPGVVSKRLRGIVLPKTERVADIAQVDTLLAELERRSAMPTGSIAIVPMIESCLGLRHAFDVATASPRVTGIVLASAEQGDFIVDLGGRWTPDSRALDYPRSKLVCDARAAGLDWIVDGVFMNLNDDAALRRECGIAREMGLVAKMAIHPAQIAAIHDAFSPSADEIDYARGLITAFDEAQAAGRGAIKYRGMMVDFANVRLAQRVLALVDQG